MFSIGFDSYNYLDNKNLIIMDNDNTVYIISRKNKSVKILRNKYKVINIYKIFGLYFLNHDNSGILDI
jgi:hypothetical protein